MQVLVPVVPLLQVPNTVAFATGLWLASWTVTVTVAVHFLPWLVLLASKLPTCMVVDIAVGVCVGVGPGVEVRVAVGVGPDVGVSVGVGEGSGVGVSVGVGKGPVDTGPI